LAISKILESIDLEIATLTRARNVLAEYSPVMEAAPTEAQPVKRRKMSKEARDRISAAQRKRWAKSNKAAK
jgi:hypothetical protein